MNRSWVRFPQAAQIRPPGNGWAFSYARVACGVAGVSGAVWPGRGAGLLDAPVGGGPPARSPHASLRLGVIDLEARPGPAAAHGHRSLAPPSPTGAAAWPCHRPRAPLPGPGLLYVAQWWLSIINFACNSPVACSNIEFASLELQRFLGLLKFGPIELHAKFIWS